jgi:hypothetical protein
MTVASSSVISLGCDAGGPEAAFIGSLKIPLAHSFAQHVTSSHCPEIDEYALVLRVDGSIAKFGNEGLERLRLYRTRRYIAVDIQIPEAVWQAKTEQELKSYLALQVTAAISACCARLKKEKWAVSERELMAQVQAATHDYLEGK